MMQRDDCRAACSFGASRHMKAWAILAAAMLIALASCFIPESDVPPSDDGTGEALYFQVNGNRPSFSQDEYAMAEEGTFISLTELDGLGRTGAACGCFDYDSMPTGEREALKTNPSGWVQNRYDIVSGGWLYNRSHQLGFQISGLQDEPRNLMTGTRQFNVDGMLPFENKVAEHMRENIDHDVLYKVTPDFHGSDLLAHGAYMETDCLDCDEIDFAVYVRNIQTGIYIDYSTGDNWLEE